MMFKLEINILGTSINYTISNTYPVSFRKKYIGPIKMPNEYLNLGTQTFLNNKAIGRILQIHGDELLNHI